MRPKRVPLTPRMQAQLVGDDETPSEEIIRVHEEHGLRHIVAKVKVQMPSDYRRDCFDLHYLQRQPSAVVAEKLGLLVCAVNTCTSRVLACIGELGREYHGGSQ